MLKQCTVIRCSAEYFPEEGVQNLRLLPAWNDTLLLAALIGLRTVLNFALDRELKHLSINNPVLGRSGQVLRTLGRRSGALY